MEPYPLFEDDKYIVFYKPPFWIMNTAWDYENETPETISSYYQGDKKPFLLFIKNFMEDNYNEKVSTENSYNVCHRLDIETSGGVLVSKKKEDWETCRRIINNKRITKKIYICLVTGVLKKKKGFIKAYTRTEQNERCKAIVHCSKFSTGEGCQDSLSYYQVLGEYNDSENKKYSLVLVRIFTGRTHQIRVHMKFLGHPIISDDRYHLCETDEEEQEYQEVNKKLINRLFLHNIFFCYKNNLNQEKYNNISIPVPDDIKRCLKKLTLNKRYKFEIKEFIINNVEMFNKKSKFPLIENKYKSWLTNDDIGFDEPKFNQSIERLLSYKENTEEIPVTIIPSTKLSVTKRKLGINSMKRKLIHKKNKKTTYKKKKIHVNSSKLEQNRKNRLQDLYNW